MATAPPSSHHRRTFAPTTAMASSRPSKPPLELSVTIVSAKHLKNVNWRNGDLKPYAAFWLDPDQPFATKSDESGSTRPVWNETFALPMTLPVQDSALTLEIFHSKPSETRKPIVGTLVVELKDLGLGGSADPTRIHTFQVRRPSGRPQGKIRIKLAVRAPPLPDYHIAPPPSYYYASDLPPVQPPARDYRGYYPFPAPAPAPAPAPYYGAHREPYSGYYSGYYSSAPPPPIPPRPFFDRPQSFVSGGPSAPVEYSSPYDQRPKSGKMGLGAGLAVGAVAGTLGGLALEDGLKYEEEKIVERVECDLAARDDYRDYRAEY